MPEIDEDSIIINQKRIYPSTQQRQQPPVMTKQATVTSPQTKRIVTIPHRLPYINNDDYYHKIKEDRDYKMSKLSFKDGEQMTLWASIKIELMPTRKTPRITIADYPTFYYVERGEFNVLVDDPFNGYNDELDTLVEREKIVIPPNVPHTFINRRSDSTSVIIGEFPYDFEISERQQPVVEEEKPKEVETILDDPPLLIEKHKMVNNSKKSRQKKETTT